MTNKTIKISCDCKDKILLTDLEQFQGNLKNRTKQDIDKIVKSIKKYGFSFPFFVWKHDGVNHCLDGHGRLEALHTLDELGFEIPQLPVVFVNCVDEQSARDLLLRLNSHYGKMTKESVLEFIGDFEIETDNLELPCGTLEFKSEETLNVDTVGDDEIPEPDDKEPIVSCRGEMYELGNSLLMCGDSTSEKDVQKLMSGVIADICFTSPPYNTGFTPTELKMNKVSKYNGVNTDDKNSVEYKKFLNTYLSLSLEYAEYSFVNIQSLSGNKISLIEFLYDNRYFFADTIIWDKINGQPAMAKNVLNSVFEYVHIFSKKGNRSIGMKEFRGTIDNIIHLARKHKNEYAKEHNATFPLEFAEFFIKKFCSKSCYEPFGGTGTTLIACEKHNKSCRCMELSEKYCDLIRRRYTKWAKQNNRPITSGCLE